MDGWTDEGRKEGRKEWIDGWIFRKGQLCNQRLASSIDVASKQASKQASERASTHSADHSSQLTEDQLGEGALVEEGLVLRRRAQPLAVVVHQAQRRLGLLERQR